MTIEELRTMLGVPPDESAAPYITPDDEDSDSGCIECGATVAVDVSGSCDCELHCEGCCDCDPEDIE